MGVTGGAESEESQDPRTRRGVSGEGAGARRARGPRSPPGRAGDTSPGAATTLGPALTCGSGSGRARTRDRAPPAPPGPRAPTPAPRGARGGEGAGARAAGCKQRNPLPLRRPGPLPLPRPPPPHPLLSGSSARPWPRASLTCQAARVEAGGTSGRAGLGVGGPARRGAGGPGAGSRNREADPAEFPAQSCHSRGGGVGGVEGGRSWGRARLHL